MRGLPEPGVTLGTSDHDTLTTLIRRGLGSVSLAVGPTRTRGNDFGGAPFLAALLAAAVARSILDLSKGRRKPPPWADMPAGTTRGPNLFPESDDPTHWGGWHNFTGWRTIHEKNCNCPYRGDCGDNRIPSDL